LLAELGFMATIIIGMAIAIVFFVVGAVTLFKRRQMAVETTQFEGSRTDVDIGASDDEEANIGVSVSVDYFKGKQRQAEFYAEISTAELLDLIKQGRWNAAWPWVAVIIGGLMLFVFLPLLIIELADLPESTRCLIVVVFIVGVLFAAWPRRNR
jgi:hypothetical protein